MPNVEYLFNTWACMPKVTNGPLKPLFDPNVGRNDTNTTMVENILSRHAYALTRSQRTCEWFLFRGFHVTATMASRIINSPTAIEDDKMIQMLLGSWFSRTRSTEEMRIGTKNEDAILCAFRSLRQVTDIFCCGLVENKELPWLAASPDVIFIVKNPQGEKVLAMVEVKTRVSPTRIAEAERIASHWNNKLIMCVVGVDDITSVMDKEHETQIMIQMAMLHLNWAVYLVGQPGMQNTQGRII
jgi:hypothetical protein